MTDSVAATFQGGADDEATERQSDYLRATSAQESIIAGKVARAHLLTSVTGGRVLDVGCGPGDFALLVAQRRPDGQVTGVDVNEGLLAEARSRAEAAGLSIEFRRGEGATLPFEDDSFDAALVERTLQHVDDPAAVLAEMARVVRPGGLVVAVEPDWHTLLIDAGDPMIADRIAAQVEDSVRNPHVGRQLHRLLVGAGLSEVAVQPEPHLTTDPAVARPLALIDDAAGALREQGAVSGAVLDNWLAALESDGIAGRFTATLTLFVARGTVPEV